MIRVVDVIRHIPYIHWGDYEQPCMIYSLTTCMDYDALWLKEHPGSRDCEIGDGDTALGPHVLNLAQSTSGRNGFHFILDTSRGTITLYNVQGTDSMPLSLVRRSKEARSQVMPSLTP